MMTLPNSIERDAPLSRLTTVGTGGPARYLGRPTREAALLEMLAWAAQQGVAIAVVGLGSNLLPADAGYDGLVLHLEGEFTAITVSSTGAVVGGGASLAAVVHKVGEAGLTGFEFACAVPGTVGGAVRMNAGAYGSEIRDVLLRARVCDAQGTHVLALDELGLAYRHSNLPSGAVVTQAEIRLSEDDPTAITARVRAMQGQRSAAQPRKARTFGSVFKNPLGDRTSGQILEACGLKGLQIGGARIAEKHANFIENTGGATSADVVALMVEARRRALAQFDVRLEHEVHLLGPIEIPPL